MILVKDKSKYGYSLSKKDSRPNKYLINYLPWGFKVGDSILSYTALKSLLGFVSKVMQG